MAATKTPAKAKTVKVDQATKPIRWTENKVALLTAFKKLGAFGVKTARKPADVAKASGGKLDEGQVRHQINPAFDLAQQGIVARAELEDGLSYYLTAKGAKVKTEAAKPVVAAK